MSKYFRALFERINLLQLSHFLRHGVEGSSTEPQPYDTALETGCAPIYHRLETIYPERKAQEEAAADLSEALAAYENVYMEVGMKAGARLLYQLLLTEDPPVGDFIPSKNAASLLTSPSSNR